MRKIPSQKGNAAHGFAAIALSAFDSAATETSRVA
jgi:hypothetical protein